MSNNVISLSQRKPLKSNGKADLLNGFSQMRRDPNNVFWLKENAELLNIFECSTIEIDASALDCYAQFYDQLPNRMVFFPQYYRFFISIACDLEALGIDGDHAQSLCDAAQRDRLLEAELSDLQRAEAMRLLGRRGIQSSRDEGIVERLHRFIDHSPTFALPNQKAAYELTHIVFYLSEYGRKSPEISKNAVQSLMFTGLLAHLDQNNDLLAEVCIALRYAGQTPPVAWENQIKNTISGFNTIAQDTGAGDQYHTYLVSNWALSQMGGSAFQGAYSSEGIGFYSDEPSCGALGQLSEALLTWPMLRSPIWSKMQDRVFTVLDSGASEHLSNVVSATSDFDAFFEHFARSPHAVFAPKPVQRPLHRLQSI